jgi:hypothetical protein
MWLAVGRRGTYAVLGMPAGQSEWWPSAHIAAKCYRFGAIPPNWTSSVHRPVHTRGQLPFAHPDSPRPLTVSGGDELACRRPYVCPCIPDEDDGAVELVMGSGE